MDARRKDTFKKYGFSDVGISIIEGNLEDEFRGEESQIPEIYARLWREVPEDEFIAEFDDLTPDEVHQEGSHLYWDECVVIDWAN